MNLEILLLGRTIVRFELLRQVRGKIERFNRRIKEKLYLVVYCSPDELKRVVDETISTYNRIPHESLDNVSPNDVYAGRKEGILQ